MTKFQEAVEAAGGLTALAKAIGVGPTRAGNWYQRGVPAEYCPAIEKASGIRCEELRGDLTWTRNEQGLVTGYHVRLGAAAAA